MQIEFTREEAQILLNLIDLAVKANGIKVAEAGLHFANKLTEACNKATPNG